MRGLLFFVMLILCSAFAIAQQTYNVTGIVTDDKDAPIPGATVFLGDSRKATISDSEGRFVLAQVQPGSYNLVVKMIGYVVLQHSFILQNKDMYFRAKLHEDNITLATANISGISYADRRAYLAIFIKSFLGSSENALKCDILNTDAIKFNFDEKRNILKARSNDFLIIENKALGYRMKYLLNEFIYDRSVTRSAVVTFYGTLYFEELTGTEKQQKKWKQERIKAYLGSVPHFFRSAFNNTLAQNGFEVYQMLTQQAIDAYSKKQVNIPEKYYEPLGSLDRFFTKTDNSFKTLNLNALKRDSTELYVVYKPKGEPNDYTQKGNTVHAFFRIPPGQTSIIRPLADSMRVDRSGNLSPVTGVLLLGYWTWSQMAGYLPADYMLPEEVEPPKNKKNRSTDREDLR